MDIIDKTELFYDALENNLTVENILNQKPLINEINKLCKFHIGFDNKMLKQQRNYLKHAILKETNSHKEEITAVWNYFDTAYAKCNFDKEKEHVIVALIPVLK
jgi:hypothetical protein